MQISLVTTTMNRSDVIGDLLASLEKQTVKFLEFVVVDQSSDFRTKDVVDRYVERIPVKYVRDYGHGAARGRNIGVTHISGDIVGFPDDDCVYPVDAVERVLRKFASVEELGFLSGSSIDLKGNPSQGRWKGAPCAIDRYNVWTTQTMYTTFYRTALFRQLGGLDETLGTGARTKWGSGEETELMLRALRIGSRGLYEPELKFMHPEPLAVFDQAALDRGRRYNRGFGRVMRMEGYPLWFVAYMAGRPLIGAAASLARGQVGQARYRAIAFSQRLRGWADRLD